MIASLYIPLSLCPSVYLSVCRKAGQGGTGLGRAGKAKGTITVTATITIK